jgi:hypothetical protein
MGDRPSDASRFSPARRALVFAGGAAFLGACAPRPVGTHDSTEVPAPTWRVGDRWVYRRTDAYRGLDAGTLTREAAARGADGVFQVVTRDQEGRLLDDARFIAPGRLASGTLSEDGPIAGRFDPPLEIYAFPLASGKAWRQSFTRTDAGGLRRYATVASSAEGWETVRAGGREHRAIVIRRRYNLGPKDSFHGDTLRSELEWYAPDLRGAVRLNVSEVFFERPNQVLAAMLPGARYLYELVSFGSG